MNGKTRAMSIVKILTSLLLAAALLTSVACSPAVTPTEPTVPPKADIDNPAPAEVPEREDIMEQTDYVTTTWVAVDIPFVTEKTYTERNEQLYTGFYADFTNRETGTKLTLPGFWDGDDNFKIRFAPTEYGIWDYVTRCAEDETLAGKTGTVAANQYKGDLAIYKHGFVTTNGTKHFVYADGTPFFYLGDTHWGMYTEEFDKPGSHAGQSGAESHFKYIVDKRVEQGFTVYQSEPISTGADLSDGFLSIADTRQFIKNDRYYQYIAEKGLVHANAEFFFASSMTAKIMNNHEYLEAISRYWVARYCAYPVMWTLAQEIDNDFYRERGDQKIYDADTNPWVLVAEYIHKYDPYQHPLTGHQENVEYTTVTGAGTKGKADNGGRSAFYSDEVTERTGHNWWAAQWSPSLVSPVNQAVVQDYYNSSKVAINYESRYCYLWTKDYGARASSWIAMLSGFAGVGYGAVDIWLYKSQYDTTTTSRDGIDEITPKDKAVYWSEAVEFESAYQHGYMRSFFEQYKWWELVPDFDTQEHFVPDFTSRDNSGPLYVCATIGSDLYLVYFYSQETSTGTVNALTPGADYKAEWFNTRTNEYIPIEEFVAPAVTEESPVSTWQVPARPEDSDFLLVVRRK